ncbi:glycosyltransferase [Paenibacillus sp. NPDC057934]|uniref:glycosyltransferase n=1 Tax=Paenibacillus sp. NPDC057934 TaxID=3346282 RepID=UPI0036DA7D28
MFFKKKTPLNQEFKISVIIPLYNHENFITEAIKSVLDQTYTNLELIVIDDGSKDNSLAVAQSFKDERLQVISQDNNGAHNTINRGLDMATGDYLTVLNSDDVYEKDRLEKCMDAFIKNPGVELVSTYIKIINDSGKTLGIKHGWKDMEPWPFPNKEKSFAKSDDFVKNLLMSNFISTTSNMVFTKELYLAIGGMRNLRFAHDWDFALRAADHGKCYLIEEPLMRYRIHGNNTIHSNRKHMLFEICWIYAAHLHRFENTHIFTGDPRSNLEELAESINLQGNDKLLWILRTYINNAIKNGRDNPELDFLDDAVLRESLFNYIAE